MASSYSQLINRKMIGQSLENLPAKLSDIFTYIYTGGSRLHPEVEFDIEEMTSIRDAVVPVIQKGTPAIPLGQESKVIKKLEPSPIEISHSVTAWEFNLIKSYDEISRQAWTNNKMMYLADRLYNTKVAMASTSLTGTMTWKQRVQSGRLVDYTATLFTPLAPSITGSWTSSTEPSVVCADLKTMIQGMNDEGEGMNPIFYAGTDVFATVMDIANAQVNNRGTQYVVGPNEIIFAGYIIRNVQFRHHTLAASGTISITSVIDSDEIYLIDQRPENFQEWYLPIDDFDMNLRPMPMWTDTYTTKNPSTMNIVMKSNPLFIPKKNTISIATAT